ncbi:MAG: PD-(D/E)XK nuclease family protein [Dehalococcoidia bacterium]|nr:PD-(D/E)XK nuclease family protein [Dehalococcoidia bacterium]
MGKRACSPSSLDKANCGYAYYREYEDPNRPVSKFESLPQARGSATHEVLAQITEVLCKEPKAVFSADVVQGWVAAAVVRHPAAYQETGQILDMAKLYIARPPNLLTSDAGIEEMFGVKYDGKGFVECDYNDPKAFARGRADIMLISDDTTFAVIYDHKTQPNIEEADTFQMGFYAWVVAKANPFLKEIRTVLHFARYGYYSQPFVWTAEDLARIEDEIVTRVMAIESRTSWEPTPHKNCQYCPYLAECPAMAEYLQPDAEGNLRIKPGIQKILGNTQKAQEVAGILTVLEELTKRLKADLREHIDKYEAPVAIPGKVFGYFPDIDKIDWKYANGHQREDIYATFKKHNVDPRKYMSFSESYYKGIWKEENEALVKDLESLFRKTTTTTFTSKKM